MAQDHKCFTCRRPIERGAEDRALLLHIDHDHACCPGARSCGKCLREILCFSCNNALGLMEDRAEVAYALGDYLTRFHAKRIERLGELVDFSENVGAPLGVPSALDERAAVEAES